MCWGSKGLALVCLLLCKVAIYVGIGEAFGVSIGLLLFLLGIGV